MIETIRFLKVAHGLWKARKLLLDAAWTQKTWARDAFQEPVHPYSIRARQYCLVGAVIAANPDKGADYVPLSVEPGEKQTLTLSSRTAEDVYSLLKYFSAPFTFNDASGRTKQEVLDYLRTYMWKAFWMALTPWNRIDLGWRKQ